MRNSYGEKNYLKCLFSLWGGAPWEILVVKLILWYYVRQLALKLYIWIFIPPRENLVVGYLFDTLLFNVTLSVSDRSTKFKLIFTQGGGHHENFSWWNWQLGTMSVICLKSSFVRLFATTRKSRGGTPLLLYYMK